jgi:hypothetical protein
MLKLTDRGNLFEHYKARKYEKLGRDFMSSKQTNLLKGKTFLWVKFSVKL